MEVRMTLRPVSFFFCSMSRRRRSRSPVRVSERQEGLAEAGKHGLHKAEAFARAVVLGVDVRTKITESVGGHVPVEPQTVKCAVDHEREHLQVVEPQLLIFQVARAKKVRTTVAAVLAGVHVCPQVGGRQAGHENNGGKRDVLRSRCRRAPWCRSTSNCTSVWRVEEAEEAGVPIDGLTIRKRLYLSHRCGPGVRCAVHVHVHVPQSREGVPHRMHLRALGRAARAEDAAPLGEQGVGGGVPFEAPLPHHRVARRSGRLSEGERREGGRRRRRRI
eukprot:485005-Prymnesium_polylepis.1